MISSKFSCLLVGALALAAGVALQAMPGTAEDTSAPAGTEQPELSESPAATDPAATTPDESAGTPSSTEAGAAASPSADPSTSAGSTSTEPSRDSPDKASGEATTEPAQPETPALATEPAAPPASGSVSTTINASQLQIGAAVFGADGTKIGELNGVKSDDTGRVQEILVTDGVAAGLNAKVFAVSGDKITEVNDGVKLSLSSEEAKKLPIIDNSNG